MSLKVRALIFSTFFGSCIAIGLLLVSLTTNQWINAYPRRKNIPESKGEVNYGLFFGNKNLNVVGTRNKSVDVYTFIKDEPDVINFWLWLITALGTGFGLLACAIAAIASVLKAASASPKHGAMILLFVSNISAAIAQCIAFICWLVQFYKYLMYNVLAMEEHKHWYSTGLVHLGFSFYLVIIATLVVLFNITILCYARRCDRFDQKRIEPHNEEKDKGDVMLY